MPDQIDDGGPAFAGTSGVDGYGNCEPFTDIHGAIQYRNFNVGMSTRMWLAGQALSTLTTKWEKSVGEIYANNVAREALRIADAVIAESKRTT